MIIDLDMRVSVYQQTRSLLKETLERVARMNNDAQISGTDDIYIYINNEIILTQHSWRDKI